MTHLSRRPLRASSPLRRFGHWSGAGVAVVLWAGAALASAPTSNELNIRFKVLKSGPTATVEIRIAPRRDFESVAVEAGSGAASVSPSCEFTQARVVAGKSYVCRIEVAGRPSEAAMTINVVAQRSVPGGTVPVLEVHHLSVRNSAFAVSQKAVPASHHDIAEAYPK